MKSIKNNSRRTPLPFLKKAFTITASFFLIPLFLGLPPANASIKMKPIEPLQNPERGFFLQSNFFAHNLVFTWDKDVRFPKSWIRKDQLKKYDVENDKISEIQLYFYLTDYVGKPLDKKAFSNMQKVLDDAKEHGFKLLLRFAYDNKPSATKATFKDIFRHLDQLEPFIQKNIGLIDMWQIGFVGAWGEGHHTRLSGDWKNRSKLAKRLLEIFTDRQITIRYPRSKKRYNLTEEETKRCGFHNDYFTASEHPKAPNNDYVFGSGEYKLVKKESPYVKVAGEIPYAQKGPWGLHENFSVISALKIFQDHHYDAFDITQNNKVNVAHWKTVPVSPELLSKNHILFDEEYFQTKNGSPCLRSAYDFIRDHLGYRLYFDLKKTKLKVIGSTLNYEIHLKNVGFSPIKNPRPVYLVLINSNKKIAFAKKIEANPAEWQPYDPSDSDYKGITHILSGKVTPHLKGRYKVGLFLPDPTKLLQKNPLYAIRFANKKIQILETKTLRINLFSIITL